MSQSRRKMGSTEDLDYPQIIVQYSNGFLVSKVRNITLRKSMQTEIFRDISLGPECKFLEEVKAMA